MVNSQSFFEPKKMHGRFRDSSDDTLKKKVASISEELKLRFVKRIPPMSIIRKGK